MGSHISPGVHTQQILDALRQIVQALRESSRRAERHVGISGAQLFVLEKLAESPALSLNDLAERTHTHQSSVSTVVARLVERGFVRRARSSDDNRRMELRLAARGRRLLTRAPDAAQDRLIRSVEQLRAVQRRALASGLHALVRGLGTSRRPPSMFFDEPHRKVRRRHA